MPCQKLRFLIVFLLLAGCKTSSATAAWDPCTNLPVSWCSNFNTIASRQVSVSSFGAVGDGTTDNFTAFTNAISSATGLGGAVIYVSTGNYKIITHSGSPGIPLLIPSNVIFRGDGVRNSTITVSNPSATEDDDTSHWGGLDARDSSLYGFTDLSIVSDIANTTTTIVLWNRNNGLVTSNIFVNNVNITLNIGRDVWFNAINNFLLYNSTVTSNYTSTGRYGGPVFLPTLSSATIKNNYITYHFGRIHAQEMTDGLIQGNTFYRDALNRDQQNGTAIESGGIELSFGKNVQVLNNVFISTNTPADEGGDGETIMTQHSNTQDVVDYGSMTAVGANSLTDANALWSTITAARMAAYSGYAVVVTSGPATGEWHYVVSLNTSTKVITLQENWVTIPTIGSMYTLHRWSANNLLIQGNQLNSGPIGITLYSGSVNCTINNNVLNNSRAIELRTNDVDENFGNNESRRDHNITLGARVTNNTLNNTLALNMMSMVNDAECFSATNCLGMQMYDIWWASNTINHYPPDPPRTYNPYPHFQNQDYWYPCFQFGPAPIQSPVTQVFQKIYYWNNNQDVDITSQLTPESLGSAGTTCVTFSPPPSVGGTRTSFRGPSRFKGFSRLKIH